MIEKFPRYDSEESTENNSSNRREFIKSWLIAATAVVGSSLIDATEVLAGDIESLSDKEKIVRFANLMNSMKDDIPQMNEGDKMWRSYINNFDVILKLLVKDRDFFDETTYHAFAYLQKMQNQTPFVIEDLDKALSYVIYHFAKNGYFFNIYNQFHDEDLFIESSQKDVRLGHYEWVVQIFPEMSEKRTSLYYIFYEKEEDKDITLWTTRYGWIFINNSEINRYFDGKFSEYKEKYHFLKNVSREDVVKFIESNELCHHILFHIYDFNARSERNWAVVDSGIVDYKIVSSGYVEEFLSDAVSMTTDPQIGIASVLASNGFKEEYEYSVTFLLQLLDKKIKEKGMEETTKTLTVKEKNQAILEVITEQDIIDIKTAYITQARILVAEIKKI